MIAAAPKQAGDDGLAPSDLRVPLVEGRGSVAGIEADIANSTIRPSSGECRFYCLINKQPLVGGLHGEMADRHSYDGFFWLDYGG